MNDFVKLILIIILLVVASNFLPKPAQTDQTAQIQQMAQTEKSHESNTATTVPSSSYKSSYPNIQTIPTEVAGYLKTAPEYANYYNSNKKFAIYYKGMSCPYGQAFARAMDSIANRYEYQEYYKFKTIVISGNTMQKSFTSTQDAQNDNKFMELCQQFCIVNPRYNEIYGINGVGEEEAAAMPNLFSSLKNW